MPSPVRGWARRGGGDEYAYELGSVSTALGTPDIRRAATARALRAGSPGGSLLAAAAGRPRRGSRHGDGARTDRRTGPVGERARRRARGGPRGRRGGPTRLGRSRHRIGSPTRVHLRRPVTGRGGSIGASERRVEPGHDICRICAGLGVHRPAEPRLRVLLRRRGQSLRASGVRGGRRDLVGHDRGPCPDPGVGGESVVQRPDHPGRCEPDRPGGRRPELPGPEGLVRPRRGQPVRRPRPRPPDPGHRRGDLDRLRLLRGHRRQRPVQQDLAAHPRPARARTRSGPRHAGCGVERQLGGHGPLAGRIPDPLRRATRRPLRDAAGEPLVFRVGVGAHLACVVERGIRHGGERRSAARPVCPVLVPGRKLHQPSRRGEVRRRSHDTVHRPGRVRGRHPGHHRGDVRRHRLGARGPDSQRGVRHRADRRLPRSAAVLDGAAGQAGRRSTRAGSRARTWSGPSPTPTSGSVSSSTGSTNRP